MLLAAELSFRGKGQALYRNGSGQSGQLGDEGVSTRPEGKSSLGKALLKLGPRRMDFRGSVPSGQLPESYGGSLMREWLQGSS